MNESDIRKKRLLSTMGLMLAALFWGISYPLTKYVENCPVYFLISIRFTVSTILLALFCRKSFVNFSVKTLKYALMLSFVITAMYVFNIWGIKHTTSVRASFFTTLSFLIVPLMNLLVYRIRISWIIAVSAVICLAGVFMLCYSPGMGGPVINFGDILCLIAAVCGSINIIFIEKMSLDKSVDNTLFTILLQAFVAVWGTGTALFLGEFSYISAVRTPELIAIVVMGIFCSAGAFLLQIHSSKYVPSNRVGIIFSLEPASGCILSVLLIHETMSLIGWTGAAVIIASILFMEIANNKKPVNG